MELAGKLRKEEVATWEEQDGGVPGEDDQGGEELGAGRGRRLEHIGGWNRPWAQGGDGDGPEPVGGGTGGGGRPARSGEGEEA